MVQLFEVIIVLFLFDRVQRHNQSKWHIRVRVANLLARMVLWIKDGCLTYQMTKMKRFYRFLHMRGMLEECGVGRRKK